ncbi:PepSY domain-containing protein [Sphingomonas sp. IC-11]|uniref:PepSY-associated TM helix domain-containing protein n=1 Tax=Sphingomonas sp. IC-11 TaxID=2898528 RepID=UPI001E4CE09B|nr:PepSY-associated TM helix domain-containing protein [Sphingomonas sp. IC-11]MCD2314535.1 PepSY domain-containing protein [Sphingomonas sp. IC-11]
MTLAPDNATVKRALSVHAAIGLVASALLYLVSLSGAVAVFYQEWQRIEQPDVPEMTAIGPAAVQRAVEAVLATEKGKPPTTHLYVHLPVEPLPRATITTDTQAFHVDPSGKIAGPEEIAWSDFLVELHYTLNLPAVLGITIVGGVGVMMLALSLSGVVAHPRIFRDAFRLRARDKGGIGLADWHNRLSVWTLPFTVAIAFTGALIGMAYVTAFGLAGTSYRGDMEAVYAPIFGAEGQPDKTAAPPPNVAAAMEYMRDHHPQVELTYVTLHDPGTAGQHVQVLGEHRRRLIFGEYYTFDAQGRFHQRAGLADGAIGQQAAASNYRLHFGNFGGLPVKVAYFLFGLVLTAICATGTYIWLGKRERRGVNEPRLRAAWDATIWGTPLMLGVTFLLRQVIGNDAPLALIFWLGMAALVTAGCLITSRDTFAKALQLALAATLALIPIVIWMR